MSRLISKLSVSVASYVYFNFAFVVSAHVVAASTSHNNPKRELFISARSPRDFAGFIFRYFRIIGGFHLTRIKKFQTRTWIASSLLFSIDSVFSL